MSEEVDEQPESIRRHRARPTRVASLAHGVLGRGSGVRRLILEQADAWAASDPDVEVGLFIRCEAGTEADWRHESHVVAVTSSRFGLLGRLLARELLSIRLLLWRPDVVYLRHSTVSPSLFVVALTVPTIVGGDLDDMDELRLRSAWRYRYARLVRDRLLRLARRIVVVTPEIAAGPAIARLGRPVDVFPNSIQLADYRELPAPDNRSPHLVFIGAPHLAWSGVDKLARLAKAFPDWVVDVVGPGPDEFPERPPNLQVHGILARGDYEPMMAGADVGIGPLALHRKGLTWASALKVAEYLAHGIPVILAHRETAFPNGAPFLLRLPATEDNVDRSWDEIRMFVERWCGHRVPRQDVAPLDSAIVEPRRLATILSVIAEPRRDGRDS